MQRGFVPILMILIVLGILLVGGYLGYQKYQNSKLESIKNFEDCAKFYPVMASYPGQCNTPDGRHFVQTLSPEEQKKLEPVQNDFSELNNFPTYPGATFVKKDYYPPCTGTTSGFSICDSDVYSWQVDGTNEQVASWYLENKSNSKWVCSGGAGSAGSYVTTTCKKGVFKYGLNISGTEGQIDILVIIHRDIVEGAVQ
jgi:hypothetical protein